MYLVSSDNPRGSVTNFNLELVGGILHNECANQCFDVWDRTIFTCTENTPML